MKDTNNYGHDYGDDGYGDNGQDELFRRMLLDRPIPHQYASDAQRQLHIIVVIMCAILCILISLYVTKDCEIAPWHDSILNPWKH